MLFCTFLLNCRFTGLLFIVAFYVFICYFDPVHEEVLLFAIVISYLLIIFITFPVRPTINEQYYLIPLFLKIISLLELSAAAF